MLNDEVTLRKLAIRCSSVDAVVIAVPSQDLPDGVQVVSLFEDQLFLASSKSAKRSLSGD
ncbi:hypothetical protein [Polynucleobacter necessarius]|uniref:hypothetical protein n=1 Tax=Polynucleobacter necessarius TaxID=576610 RepID=UPI000E09B93E|nr:hypothetical protein [Polynucleobacter necessarius]HAT39375.1 hypothetical protein [Polynucleobacter sp.]